MEQILNIFSINRVFWDKYLGFFPSVKFFLKFFLWNVSALNSSFSQKMFTPKMFMRLVKPSSSELWYFCDRNFFSLSDVKRDWFMKLQNNFKLPRCPLRGGSLSLVFLEIRFKSSSSPSLIDYLYRSLTDIIEGIFRRPLTDCASQDSNPGRSAKPMNWIQEAAVDIYMNTWQVCRVAPFSVTVFIPSDVYTGQGY